MRTTCISLLLAAAACVAQGAQVPLLAPPNDGNPSWDKDPDVDATGNRIFTSVSELMQLWPGTVVVQGHSFAPCTIPVGTVFYHGRGDEHVPTVPEWLAFDFEHSYFFTFGREPHVLTFVTKRALRILNFDGLSAHLSTESQSIIMYGEVRSGPVPTFEIAKRLCAWGVKNGIDGFIRMEEHFELIECDFESSFDLLASLRVIPQDERTKDGGRFPGGRFPVERPAGWVGSLPTDSRSEVDVAGKWHDRAPGETRVRVQYDKFVSFYDPAVTSLVESRRDKPREEHTLKPLSKADAQTKLVELEAALAQPWDAGSGVDWASIVHVVVERYGERIEVLAHTLAADAPHNSSSLSASVSYEIAFKARQQVLIMLAPHFTTSDTPGSGVDSGKAWLTPVVERCAATHTRGLPAGSLVTTQEVLIRGAIEDVMQQICRRLARMFYLTYDIEVEDKRLGASSVVGRSAGRGARAHDVARLDAGLGEV
ncbi:hypothetical protein MVEN_00245400 [Mycena venus]|uniref:Uncharacterized protein n=1 Tax=Mycena venus TaxID=2733690 RepID=A0A8H6Z1M5_9AGAR|nr:hypothetical protein MVEN_00245400 [Mycena venus]